MLSYETKMNKRYNWIKSAGLAAIVMIVVCITYGCMSHVNSIDDRTAPGYTEQETWQSKVDKLTLVLHFRQPHKVSGPTGSALVVELFTRYLLEQVSLLEQQAVLRTNSSVDDLTPELIRQIGFEFNFRWGIAAEIDVDGEFDFAGSIVFVTEAKCAILDTEKGEILWKGQSESVFSNPPSQKNMKDLVNALAKEALRGLPRMGSNQ